MTTHSRLRRASHCDWGRKFQRLISSLLLLWTFSAAATDLGVQGDRFTINGQTRFLLGISYYGGLGARDAFVDQDLDKIQRDGFNWIRVWANWAAFDNDISAINSDGSAREPFLQHLKTLIQKCDQRGMVVDVTLAREKSANGPPRLLTLPEHRRAVETIVSGLRPWRNWYLDLANERNVKDSRFVSYEELKTLRDRAKELDAHRLITASHSSADADFIREMENYLRVVRVDFLCNHRPRHQGASGETEPMTRRYRERMKELGIIAPMHYQEPFRRGYEKFDPKAEDFLRDLRGAIEGGAAGWCFHNGSQRHAPNQFPRRSFDLREQRLYEQLDEVEREVVASVKAVRRETLKKSGQE